MIKKLPHYPVIPLLLFYFWMAFDIAWLSDDAYITIRSVENFIHGYGPVFNIGERVQAFTHPLWFLVQSALNWLLFLWGNNPIGGGQTYLLNVFASLGFSALAAGLIVFKIGQSNRGIALAICVWALSKAALDYSTSGLENPLTHFLLALFVMACFSQNGPNLLWLSFLAALAGLNRPDLLLFFAPALGWFWLKSANKAETFWNYSLGFLPLILWETFSLFYYGSLFPNTAYAKIYTHIPLSALLPQGLAYYRNSFQLDPITLLTIGFTGALTLFRGTPAARSILGGILLYLVYIVYIGGDFMSGRFFSAPLFLSVCILSVFDWTSARGYFPVLVTVLVVGITPFFTIPERSPAYRDYSRNFSVYVDEENLVNDERMFYLRYSLKYALEQKSIPTSDYTGSKWVYEPDIAVVRIFDGRLGRPGYEAGPSVHIVDIYALADPLLARLPLLDLYSWRVGHYRRGIPIGYKETLQAGVNVIKDPNIALYYEKLSVVTKGDLWSADRLIEIWNINTGEYDHLLENIYPGSVR